MADRDALAGRSPVPLDRVPRSPVATGNRAWPSLGSSRFAAMGREDASDCRPDHASPTLSGGTCESTRNAGWGPAVPYANVHLAMQKRA
jgi:hypothetical protein